MKLKKMKVSLIRKGRPKGTTSDKRQDERYITMKQMCELIGISKMTGIRWLREDRITKATKCGRLWLISRNFKIKPPEGGLKQYKEFIKRCS